jgi:hypothetical protein
MAIFHRATVTPTKAELIAEWAPTRPWGPPAGAELDVIGSFRFDDPDGRVGMETHLVAAGDTLFQVPLTYRDEPFEPAAASLITQIQHSVLGTRWVYDGLADPLYVVMLAGVTMTGQGEALGMVVVKDRWYIVPSNVRIQGGGWTEGFAAVDGFTSDDPDAVDAVLRNDRFALTVHRRPARARRPPIALTATWDGQADAIVLAEVTEH